MVSKCVPRWQGGRRGRFMQAGTPLCVSWQKNTPGGLLGGRLNHKGVGAGREEQEGGKCEAPHGWLVMCCC